MPGPAERFDGVSGRGEMAADAATGIHIAPAAVRVLVLTAPVGEGHVAAARALAGDIRRINEKASVTVCDVLPALPRPLRWLLSDAYRWQLRAAPWLFGLLFGGLRRSRVLRALARAGLSLTGSRGLQRVIRRHPADVIVSTWPAATTILGCLRLRGKVRVPACATITDLAGLELWADKGIDLHLVMHEELVQPVERVAGCGSARLVSPLVMPQFLSPRSQFEARRALGLPVEGTVVVVSGGGWAVGDLDGAVETALELDDTSVVCLAGRDSATRVRLEYAFGGEPRVTVLGFTDEMSDLLAAADVLVHSTGGVTCLEALARGCPIVAFGAPPGHAPLLAREMAALGLGAHARSAAELRDALVAASSKPTVPLAQGVGAASLVLAAAPRVVVRVQARLARTAATAAALSLMFFALLASDATYPVVAEALALPESTSFSPQRQAVALVVRGEPSELMAFAPIARAQHLHASVAASEPLTTADVTVLREAGLDPLPELRTGGVASLFDVHGQLEGQVARYRLRGRFYYLAPHEGFTFGDYLLARHLGGTPIQAGYDLPNRQFDLHVIHPGEVLVASLGQGQTDELLASVRRLENGGLAVSSVRGLTSIRRSP